MKLIFSIFFLLISQAILAQTVWINEIHYDNAGTDNNECIEIAGPAGTDLSDFTIYLYNGSNGTTYDTEVLSGIIPDEGCGYGALSFCYPSNGLQNGGPDGIVLYNSSISIVIQFLSYEGTFTATNGVANGLGSTDIGVTENNSTTIGTSLQLTGSGSSYGDFSWSGSSAESQGTLNTGQSITPCGSGSTNTIAITSVSSLSYSVDCTTGDNGSTDFNSVGTFNAGNTYTVQLSDASGSFASPTNIGSSVSTANTGTINFTIPPGTPSGTGYRIRVISDNPSVISPDNGSDITITLTESCNYPYMTSLLSNSCSTSGCSEGQNELVFLNSGGFSFLANETNFNFEYGTNAPPAANTNYSDVLVTNPTTTAALNAAAGCPGLFVEGTNVTIPPNSPIIFANTNLCDDALDWTGLCGQGPIYIIYNDDPSWNLVGGNFVNSTGAGMRYLNTTITTTDGTTTSIDYSFDRTQNSGTDGDYQNYSPSGGPATSYGNDGCTVNPILLPISLIKFSGKNVQNRYNLISWDTESEQNNDYFTLFASTDGINWNELTNMNGAGNSSFLKNYNYDHFNYENTINYYKLRQTDFDGTSTFSSIISIDNRDNKTITEIYNLLGQKVNKEFRGVKIIQYDDGSSKKVVGVIIE